VDETICETCKRGYDPTDAEAVAFHTERLNLGCCGRCIWKPNCYTCMGSGPCRCSLH
jgi:hypothetical protein